MILGGKETILDRPEVTSPFDDPVKGDGLRTFRQQHASRLDKIEEVRPGSCLVLEDFARALRGRDFKALDEIDLGPIRALPVGKKLVEAVRDSFL